MRRLGRWLLTLCAATSLLAGAAICVLWARMSRDGAPDRDLATRYFATLGARYTLRAEGGRFVLYGPPPLSPATLQQGTARTRKYPRRGKPPPLAVTGIPPCKQLPSELIAAARNADLVWEVYREADVFGGRGGRSPVSLHFSPRGGLNTPTCHLMPRAPLSHDEDGSNSPQEFPSWRLPPYDLPQTARLLLAALEDPDRWIAAHVALDWIGVSMRREDRRSRYTPIPDSFSRAGDIENQFVTSIDGLAVRLRGGGPETKWYCCSMSYGTVLTCEAGIDSARQALLVQQWHRRLDVVVAALAPWQLAAVTAVVPLAWSLGHAGRVWRGRSRRRRGLCARCGYDLRSSPGRCPECGETASAIGGKS